MALLARLAGHRRKPRYGVLDWLFRRPVGGLMKPTRPVLRWHGGKWMLAPWILQHFPTHRVYVEPFGGAASVLLRKDRAFSEIYNDLDGDVVGLFRVLRDRKASARLIVLLRLTPFGRAEFNASYGDSPYQVERARRLIVRSYMGFGSDSAQIAGNTGFRAQRVLSNRSPEKDWANYPGELAHAIERLREVVIERRPAMRVMQRHDSPETLHYVDPPYMPETRSTKARKGGTRYHAYQHEMCRADHEKLLAFVRALTGYVVLSGYPTRLYEDALQGWKSVQTSALAD
jgi:DNA adenine methylase